MRHPYIPRGRGEEPEMLQAVGVEHFEDLLAPVPAHLRMTGPLDLPAAMSEVEVTRHIERLAAANTAGAGVRAFQGAGSYDHHVPAIIDHLSFRSEFYTAYTPYQPEVGQGTLQAVFEFQTLMSELTGMDLANASLYDGATALAEAMLLATATTKRSRIAVAGPLHPHYLEVLHTYARGQGIEVDVDPAPQGVVDASWLAGALAKEPAGVVAQGPNFLGLVEDHTDLFTQARNVGALGIAVFQPQALALYRTPGDMGADLAVGEGMSLGTPPQFGGPALGLFAASKRFVRLVPGRLIGETVDLDGKRAFVMTLQTREQHIRRERATSNICTNQGLLALRASIYLSLLGDEGFHAVATHSMERAHYAANKLAALPGCSLPYGGPFFREFVLECPRPAKEIILAAAKNGIIPGVDLGAARPDWSHHLLVCATEKHDRVDLDALVKAVATAVGEAAHV